MPDESRIAPGQTLHVTLITGPLRNKLHNIARSAATGCSICGRPWEAHTDPDYFHCELECERCGAPLDPGCFYTYLATAAEVRWHHTADHDDDEAGRFIFMCRGCRQ